MKTEMTPADFAALATLLADAEDAFRQHAYSEIELAHTDANWALVREMEDALDVEARHARERPPAGGAILVSRVLLAKYLAVKAERNSG